MAMLKSYTCSKCAGVLLFDSDQEFFDCPFCGTTFGAADFHGNEIMDQAKDCHRKQSFDAAKEKYYAVLENEPDNFDAHLGIVLCELKVISVDDLKERKVLDGKELTNARRALMSAKRQLPKDQAAYFSKINDLVNIQVKINRYENEKNELLKSEDAQDMINRKLLEIHQEQRLNDRFELLKGWPVVLILLPFLALTELFENPATAAVFFVTLVGIVILVIVGVNRSDEEEDEQYKPALYIERSLKGKIMELDRNYIVEYRKLDGLYPKLPESKNTQSEQAETKENSSVSDSDIKTDEMIICSKCAAKLFLDKKKRVYECDHCGVAYGVSLFFGMPMEKALNSINTGFYGDAEKRVDSILMVHPSDFEANLGRILCEGRWSKISDIDLTDDVSPSRVKEIKQRIADALQHTSVENKPYFENLNKLIAMFDTYSTNSRMLDVINNAVEEFDAKTEVFSMAFSGPDFREKSEAERKAIISRSYAYQAQNKKITADFSTLRKTIIDMRSDSPLTK